MTQVPKTYLITGPPKISADEFAEHYEHYIRKSNAEFPNCKYILGDATPCDKLAQQFLRQIGVDPVRVTIFYLQLCQLDNPYHYNTAAFNDHGQMYNTMISMSTNDLYWIDESHLNTLPQKVARVRLERLQIRKSNRPRVNHIIYAPSIIPRKF